MPKSTFATLLSKLRLASPTEHGCQRASGDMASQLALTITLVFGAMGGILAAFIEAGAQPQPFSCAISGSSSLLRLPVQEKQPLPRVDLHGDPLPENAISRLGTVRFRQRQTNALAYAADGNSIIAGGRGPDLCIWAASTGKHVQQVLDAGEVISLAISSDGRLLLAGSYQSLSLINLANGKTVSRFATLGRFDSVALDPSGKIAAAGCILEKQPAVVLWDIQTGQELHRLAGGAKSTPSIAFSPDGKQFVTATDDAVIRIYDAATYKELHRIDSPNGKHISVSFAPDSKTFASVAKNGTIQILDVQSGKAVQFIEGNVDTMFVLHAPSGKQLASAREEGTVRLWDLSDGKEIRSLRVAPYLLRSVAFSPDGETLVSAGGDDHAVRRWNCRTGAEIKIDAGHMTAVHSLSFMADVKSLISSDINMQIREWDWSTGQKLRTFLSRPTEPVGVRLWCPTGSEALSWDGKKAAIPFYVDGREATKQEIRVWDTTTGKILLALTPNSNVSKLTFSPDGKFLVAVAEKGIQIWDMTSGSQPFNVLPNPPDYSTPFISPDSQLLALIGAKTVCMIELIHGKEQIRFDVDLPTRVSAAAFSPDGKLISATWRGSEVKVWATTTGKEVMRLQKDGAYLSSLAFSPTGRILAVGGGKSKAENPGERSVIQLFDAHSGEPVRTINSPQDTIYALAFSRNGQVLASGSYDSTILTWDLTRRIEKSKPAPLNESQLTALWTDLGSEAAKAEAAIWALSFAPEQANMLLRKRLQPATPAPAAQLAKLFVALDHERFAERQQAAKMLQELGESAEAGIRKALEGNLSLEVRQRLRQFIDMRDKHSDVNRRLRAIEVLEQIGDIDSKQVLELLAKGSPTPRVAEAATAALGRLSKQQQ